MFFHNNGILFVFIYVLVTKMKNIINSKPANLKMVHTFAGGVSLCSGRFFASNKILSYVVSMLWRFNVNFKAGGLVSIVPRKQ